MVKKQLILQSFTEKGKGNMESYKVVGGFTDIDSQARVFKILYPCPINQKFQLPYKLSKLTEKVGPENLIVQVHHHRNIVFHWDVDVPIYLPI